MYRSLIENVCVYRMRPFKEVLIGDFISMFNLISTIDTKHHTQAVNTHKTVNYTIADAIDM